MSLDKEKFYEFGTFRVDTVQRVLFSDGQLIPLSPKAFETLLALVENQGRVMGKDDLLKTIWPDTFVEEGSLAQNISILRKVLGEAANGQPYIQTIPKRGYRFVMPYRRQSPSDDFQNTTNASVASVRLAEPAPSIAILPFANMSGDKEQEYFSDGLAEEIINALAQVPGLKVTARTSSFAFRGKKQDITKIAKVLHVGAILEGSVRKLGNRLRVTAQLINAVDGYQIWSERYDRELADVFAMQDEIAGAIAGALQLKLIGRPVAWTYQPNPGAYDVFLRGRHELNRDTPDSFSRAKLFMEQAIALDAGYSEPHAELGQYYFLLGAYSLRPVKETMPLARAHAQRALALSAAEPRAHAVLCGVASTYDHDWEEAGRQFRLALAVEPVPSEVRGRCACNYLLPLGQLQEALVHFETVLEQDPLNIPFRGIHSVILSFAELYEQALAEAQAAVKIDSNHWLPHFAISLSHVMRGELVEARVAAEASVGCAPWQAQSLGLLTGILANLGEVDGARELLGSSGAMVPTALFFYSLLSSDIDAAADYYAKMIAQREPAALWYAASNLLKPLRSSPRWPALAQMMNLSADAMQASSD